MHDKHDDYARRQVVLKYFHHATTEPNFLRGIDRLQGKALACYCAPKLCHGDVLAALADTHSLWRNGGLPSMTLSYLAHESPSPVFACFVGDDEDTQWNTHEDMREAIEGAIRLYYDKKGKAE